jgi:hypothetical protein
MIKTGRQARNRVMNKLSGIALLLSAGWVVAAEIHVAKSGDDRNPGSTERPLLTISAAARIAMPGDTVTVHAGTYREHVDPPRGGESDTKRIVYQAAPGEKVVITGSEPAKGWKHVAGDTWKLVIPSRTFGNFNPYVDRIHGDWFKPMGRVHHTGCVYLNGNWMMEAIDLESVMHPPNGIPLWFASVDGDEGEPLVNVAWFKPEKGKKISAGEPSFRYGTKPIVLPDGATGAGNILNGHWMRFDGVDFGPGSDSIEFQTASREGTTLIEIRVGNPAGELLGNCEARATAGWQEWKSFHGKIKPTTGKKDICLIFKTPELDAGNTTIHAQFPGGVDPNEADVEINHRQTVFYPSRNFINYITVRGFILENAATNWAPPSSEQKAIIGTNWSKGWIIENNIVRHSICSGISLGKYGDGFDNTNDQGEADPYTACVKRALANGWNKETIGSHVVRGNHISRCEQAGIVGSMGAAFSTITGNVIHDIHVRKSFAGAERGGIKFHGAIDTLIAGNHIHNTHGSGALWLDWMTQGTRVTGNLMHDNGGRGDLWIEVNHGPYLVDHNILLSGSIEHQSHGGAYVNNLMGRVVPLDKDERKTPFFKANSTEIAGIEEIPDGDDRFYNNIFIGGGLQPYDRCPDGSVSAAGNVYLQDAQPTRHETKPLLDPEDAGLLLEKASDGLYLNFTLPPLPDGFPARRVTAGMLGKPLLVGLGFTNPDGSPVSLDADYFGNPHAAKQPYPGPFPELGPGKHRIKVWPKETTRGNEQP